jgi:undecaprenyl-diphosphatase
MFPMQSRPAPAWLEYLLEADRWLLLKVNRDWHHPLLDGAALVLREAVTHAPLYLFLVLFMAMNHGRAGLRWVLAAFALAGVSDLLSSHVIKEVFDRPRPCRDPQTAHDIRFIARYCGMNGSFISSHASNHFALAAFTWLRLGGTGRPWWLMLAWAGAIAYAQVYVGVHYPSDILCGALFGALLGWLAHRITRTATDPSKPAS